ncbi:MAG: hypothetical protein JRI55_39385, partial [Deltaproteobacteria bacterium]|nr:hypothetical protein [Deltaproteobacteria bacterium]
MDGDRWAKTGVQLRWLAGCWLLLAALCGCDGSDDGPGRAGGAGGTAGEGGAAG